MQSPITIRGARAAAALLFVLVVFGVVSAHYQRLGLMAPDESYFTLACREVYAGRLPYVDFAYTQMPLFPYINGAALKMLGFGLASHRLVSSLWSAIGLAVLVFALYRRTGRWEVGVLAGFALAASVRWTFLQSMGVWAGLSGMLTEIALAAVLTRGRLWRRATVFALAGALCVGCRLSCVIHVAVLAVPLLLEAQTLRGRLWMLAGFCGLGAALIAPFALLDPAAFLFMNWQYHLESTMNRALAEKALQWWDLSPAVLVLFALSAFALPTLWRRRAHTELFVWAAGLAGLVVPMLPASAWGVYASAGVPLAAAAACLALFELKDFAARPERFAAYLLPALALVHPLPLEVAHGAATDAQAAGRFIATKVAMGPVLGGPAIAAVEAGRKVLPGTEMAVFSAMRPGDSRAARFHMTSLPRLINAVEAQQPAAIVRVVKPGAWHLWNYRWALPANTLQPVDWLRRYEDAVTASYETAFMTQTLEVLVRRKADETPAPR